MGYENFEHVGVAEVLSVIIIKFKVQNARKKRDENRCCMGSFYQNAKHANTSVKNIFYLIRNQ